MINQYRLNNKRKLAYNLYEMLKPVRENDTRVVDDTIHYDPMMADTFA